MAIKEVMKIRSGFSEECTRKTWLINHGSSERSKKITLVKGIERRIAPGTAVLSDGRHIKT